MKSARIVSLKNAVVGDIVEVTIEDCWKIPTDIRLGFYVCKSTIGLVFDKGSTIIHEHPYLIVMTRFGKVTIKKGGW